MSDHCNFITFRNLKLISSYFDNKVCIFENNAFIDDRGSLIELWRSDDSIDCQPQMSYWSETNPFFIRGPHQHTQQTDLFVSYKSKMMYMFFDPNQDNKCEYFFTDENKIYTIIVKPPIVHAYRNIGKRCALTGNFPNQLWAGYGKKEKVDEVRYEHLLEKKPVIIVLGSKGRLGSAITYKFLKEMQLDRYHFIPFDEKITPFQSEEINEVIDYIINFKKYIKSDKVYVINCIGKTDVASLEKNETQRKEAFWANTDLPFLFGEKLSKNNIYFIHFSSDYVYQSVKEDKRKTVKESTYTTTKKAYENLLYEIYKNNIPSYIFSIRVSNLFSVNLNDHLNVIRKIKNKINRNAIIEYDPNQRIGITDVDVIANWIFDAIQQQMFENELHKHRFINLVSPAYTIPQFIEKFFGSYMKCREVESPFNDWFSDFCYDEAAKIIHLPSSDESIRAYINIIS